MAFKIHAGHLNAQCRFHHHLHADGHQKGQLWLTNSADRGVQWKRWKLNHNCDIWLLNSEQRKRSVTFTGVSHDAVMWDLCCHVFWCNTLIVLLSQGIQPGHGETTNHCCSTCSDWNPGVGHFLVHLYVTLHNGLLLSFLFIYLFILKCYILTVEKLWLCLEVNGFI